MIEQAKVNMQLMDLLSTLEETLSNDDDSTRASPNKPQLNESDESNKPVEVKVKVRIKILMLTANPANTTKLNLDKEHSNIIQKLQEKQDEFTLLLKKAVSGTEFKEFTEINKPDILHFSGHGAGGKYKGIIVQNDDKNEEELISIEGLEALFEYFKEKFAIKVVLLNACHTEEQAKIISHFVDYVIGTNVAIGDIAASAFSSGFYFQLAQTDTLDIHQAYKSGRTEAIMKGAKKSNFVIYKNGALLTI
jgi:CHAT domain-containing protein